MLSERDIGGVPVLDGGGRLVGIVTDSDFAGKERYVPFSYPATKLPAVFGEWVQGEPFEVLCERARRLPAGAVVSSPVVTASEEEPVEKVVERMLHPDVNLVPQITSPIECATTAERTLALREKLEQTLAFATGLVVLLVTALLA